MVEENEGDCKGAKPLCEGGKNPICVNGNCECPTILTEEENDNSNKNIDGSEQGNSND